MYGKKRPIAIPWYPIGIFRMLSFKFIGGCNPPPVRYVMKNGLVIRGLTTISTSARTLIPFSKSHFKLVCFTDPFH